MKKKLISKLSFNISVISGVLCGGIVLSGSKEGVVEAIALGSLCIVSSCVYIKKLKK